jgi:hypothetical protein
MVTTWDVRAESLVAQIRTWGDFDATGTQTVDVGKLEALVWAVGAALAQNTAHPTLYRAIAETNFVRLLHVVVGRLAPGAAFCNAVVALVFPAALQPDPAWHALLVDGGFTVDWMLGLVRTASLPCSVAYQAILAAWVFAENAPPDDARRATAQLEAMLPLLHTVEPRPAAVLACIVARLDAFPLLNGLLAAHPPDTTNPQCARQLLRDIGVEHMAEVLAMPDGHAMCRVLADMCTRPELVEVVLVCLRDLFGIESADAVYARALVTLLTSSHTPLPWAMDHFDANAPLVMELVGNMALSAGDAESRCLLGGFVVYTGLPFRVVRYLNQTTSPAMQDLALWTLATLHVHTPALPAIVPIEAMPPPHKSALHAHDNLYRAHLVALANAPAV